jgi:hypothetical protein
MVYKSLKSLFILTIEWGIARSPRSGIFGLKLISDSYAAIFLYITGNHDKKENEILSIRTL